MTSRTSNVSIGMIRMSRHSRYDAVVSISLPLFTIVEMTEDSDINRSNISSKSSSNYDIVMKALYVLNGDNDDDDDVDADVEEDEVIIPMPPAATPITDNEGNRSEDADDDGAIDDDKNDDSRIKLMEEIKQQQRRLRSVSRWDAESSSNESKRGLSNNKRSSSRGVGDCFVDRPPTRPVRNRNSSDAGKPTK